MANEINIGINTTSNLDGLNKVDESVKSLKTQLKEAQANVAALSDTFGATSKQAVEAAKSAAMLKDKISDAKALTDAFNPDAKFKAVSSSLSGVAGGFSAVTGAMGLFGEKSKDVEAAILKVQSAMALASGVQAIGESVDAFKQLGAVIKSTTIFQRISTTAQYLWNAAMEANPIGATIAAITALVTAGYFLIKMFQKSKPTIDLAAEALKKHTEATKKNNEEIKKSIEKKKEDEEYQYRLMKAQGIGEITILKTAVANAKATQSIANKNYQTAHEIALAEYLEIVERKKLAAQLEVELQQAKNQGDWTLNVDARIEKNKEEIKSIQDKYKVDNETNKLRVEDKINADKEVVKANQNLNVALAQEKIDKNKKDSEQENNRTAEQQKKKDEQQKVSDEKAKERADKSKELLAQQLKEQEDSLANSEVKKENLRNERAKKEIEKTVEKKDQILALANEEAKHVKLLEEAKTKDKQDAYAKEIEIQNSRDIGFEEDLQKQLEHYEKIFAIQVKYGKDTKEVHIQIDKTKKALNEENYKKDLEALNIQDAGFEDDLKKRQAHDEKVLELQKKYGLTTLEIDAKIVADKEAIAQAELDMKRMVADKTIQVAGQAGQLLQEIAGKSKGVAIGGVIIEKAASIAGIISSTAQANAQFLANPASAATLGVAAISPIALNNISAGISIASILAQSAKSIAEINGAKSSDGGGDSPNAPKPSKFATGGLVQGMGTSTSDSIMANLSNGESVINAKSTAMFGNLLSQINQAGGGVGFGNQNQANPIFKTYVVASEMTSQIEANLKLKQIARL